MKKIISFILLISMTFGLSVFSSCDKDNNNDDADNNGKEPRTTITEGEWEAFLTEDGKENYTIRLEGYNATGKISEQIRKHANGFIFEYEPQYFYESQEESEETESSEMDGSQADSTIILDPTLGGGAISMIVNVYKDSRGNIYKDTSSHDEIPSDFTSSDYWVSKIYNGKRYLKNYFKDENGNIVKKWANDDNNLEGVVEPKKARFDELVYDENEKAYVFEYHTSTPLPILQGLTETTSQKEYYYFENGKLTKSITFSFSGFNEEKMDLSNITPNDLTHENCQACVSYYYDYGVTEGKKETFSANDIIEWIDEEIVTQ